MFVGTREDRACLSFSFLFRYLWAHKEIVIASIFCFPIDLCSHTRRYCLTFFSDCFSLRSMEFLSDRSLLAYGTGMSAPLQHFGCYDLSRYFIVLVRYRCTVSTRSRRWWSLCLTYTWNRSRIVFLLNFGLTYLPFLVNDGSDKPSKYWPSLYVERRTWIEVEVCLE